MPSRSPTPSPARSYKNAFPKMETVPKEIGHHRGSPQKTRYNFGTLGKQEYYSSKHFGEEIAHC
jgi:hypothetical protein